MASIVAPGLERRLRAEIDGDVLFDSFDRGRYATDASHYQMIPMGVVVPRTIDAALRAMTLACEEGVRSPREAAARPSAVRPLIEVW
jgi:FAD/FMN-containing dehydrogenase